MPARTRWPRSASTSPVLPRSSPRLLPHGTKGKAYSTTLAARGDDAYTWGHTGTFPPGMGFNTTTGVLSGTPAKSGSYTVTFKLTDSGKPRLTATKTLTLVIAA